ncbi:probable basic-leucine zipper transcription factor S [Microplitis mediator]|uniref:probable basic-leucine zipper transcription factor S n=1 Tax=Microplitis mediator TaxID=375433 RepID=UPI00255460C2|nr:probable basic-leucine zipper transcription factor S [Microplitis mediator]
MKPVVVLLLTIYVTTISAHGHSELCGFGQGVNPCRECDSGNAAFLASERRPKLPRTFVAPSVINELAALKKTIASVSRNCNKPGGCGTGSATRTTPEQTQKGPSVAEILSLGPNVKLAPKFNPIGDLCTHKAQSRSNLLTKGRKMLVKPARPGRVLCKTDKFDSSSVGAVPTVYNSENHATYEIQQNNDKFTNSFNNIMNKMNFNSNLNSHGFKETSSNGIFRGDTMINNNVMNKISSNNLMSSGSSISNNNIFSKLTNIFNEKNANTPVASGSDFYTTNILNTMTKFLSNDQSTQQHSANQESVVKKNDLTAKFLTPAMNIHNTNNLNMEMRDSHSKSSKFVNILDPSTGNPHTVSLDELCDGRDLTYEEQEKVYKGVELPIIPADALTWKLTLEKIFKPLMTVDNREIQKKVNEGQLGFGPNQPPINDLKKPKTIEIPEEKLHIAEQPTVEFKSPAMPEKIPIPTYVELGYKSYEPPKNTFIIEKQSPARVEEITRTVVDEVPCGNMGPALPDYHPGEIIAVERNDNEDSCQHNQGNYQVNQQSYSESFINTEHSREDQVRGGYLDSNNQHSLTCSCI